MDINCWVERDILDGKYCDGKRLWSAETVID